MPHYAFEANIFIYLKIVPQPMVALPNNWFIGREVYIWNLRKQILEEALWLNRTFLCFMVCLATTIFKWKTLLSWHIMKLIILLSIIHNIVGLLCICFYSNPKMLSSNCSTLILFTIVRFNYQAVNSCHSNEVWGLEFQLQNGLQ